MQKFDTYGVLAVFDSCVHCRREFGGDPRNQLTAVCMYLCSTTEFKVSRVRMSTRKVSAKHSCSLRCQVANPDRIALSTAMRAADERGDPCVSLEPIRK